MKLAVILAIGESLIDLQRKGQAARMVDYNIKNYCKNFDEVFLFSYANETWSLPKNCYLIPNKYNIPRLLYSILMPLLNWKKFKNIHVIRAFQITAGPSATVAKLLFNKKFIVNYGYDYPKVAALEGKLIRSLLLIPLTVVVTLFANAIIVTNKVLISNLPRYSRNRIRIIPNGVDTEAFKPSHKTRKSDELSLLFVGRIEKEKNLEHLFKAIAGNKNVFLTVIGQGSKEKPLKGLAKSLELKARFISKVDYRELPKYYREADIFVLPSFSEGHSKVLLEAQASGLACIASDIPANRQIITDGVNGLLCKTSSGSIRKAIKRISNDSSLMSKIQKSARSTAVKEFDVTKLVAEEIKLIKSLV